MINREFVRNVGYWPFLKRFVWRQFNKRALRRGINVRLPTGLTMYAPPWSQSASEVFYADADVDWGSEGLLVDHLDPDGTFLDVGAHIGYYALYAAPRVKRVYAFEPDARSFAVLKRNLEQCPHAQAVNKAVYSCSATMDIIKRSDTSGSVRLNLADNVVSGGCQRMEVVSIDDWMSGRENERITSIKIDIDGLDFEVLKGAERTIARDQPLVLMEFLSSEVNNLDDLFRFIESLDYQAFAYYRRSEDDYSLRRLTSNIAGGQTVKMIFVVPCRLIDSFVAQCAQP